MNSSGFFSDIRTWVSELPTWVSELPTSVKLSFIWFLVIVLGLVVLAVVETVIPLLVVGGLFAVGVTVFAFCVVVNHFD
jgi:hypothetical protein